MKRRLALLFAFFAAGAAAETLGRLFFTPEQRAALDRQRQSGDGGMPVEEAASVRLDGVMKSSSGRSASWRNGQAVAGKEPGLKVGETIDAASGARTDVVAAGAVRIDRRRSAP